MITRLWKGDFSPTFWPPPRFMSLENAGFWGLVGLFHLGLCAWRAFKLWTSGWPCRRARHLQYPRLASRPPQGKGPPSNSSTAARSSQLRPRCPPSVLVPCAPGASMESWDPAPGVTSGPNLGLFPCHLGGFWNILTEDSTEKPPVLRPGWTGLYLTVVTSSSPSPASGDAAEPRRDHWALHRVGGTCMRPRFPGDSSGSGLP